MEITKEQMEQAEKRAKLFDSLQFEDFQELMNKFLEVAHGHPVRHIYAAATGVKVMMERTLDATLEDGNWEFNKEEKKKNESEGESS